MALKALMLKRRIDLCTGVINALLAKDEEFKTRESELAKAIEEATSDEEITAVNEEIDALNAEKDAHEAEKKAKEEELAGLKADLESEEAKQDTEPAEEPTPEAKPEERKVDITMNRRSVFAKMDVQTRDALFAREDVKGWLGEFRSAIKEKRAINNIGLTIPEVMLGILRENVENYSKLLSKVDARYIKGVARELVGGSIPEAVWTECCANLNELDLSFSDVELDCWKIGGFISVCKASLEDSDIDLAAEILTALGQAIGYAVDKAILYGRNTDANSKMPLGIVSRLAQTSQPAGYSATQRAWADLHTSHMLTIANTVTGLNLFLTIMLDNAVTSNKYARGNQTWVMNQTTYTFLMAQAASINAAGAMVSAVGNQMPMVGGDIVILDFVPDYNIITGYFENYLLAIRRSAEFDRSEHVKFTQDKIVFKGTQRMDGAPVIAEAFTVIAVNSASATSEMTFAADNANEATGIILDKNAATVTADAGTNHTVKLKATILPEGVDGNITWATSASSNATVSSSGVVTGVSAGSAVITATVGGAVAVCNVTVS